MKDVLTTATMLTGFAAFAAAIGAAVMFIGAKVLTPAFLGVADYATSIAIAANLAG